MTVLTRYCNGTSRSNQCHYKDSGQTSVTTPIVAMLDWLGGGGLSWVARIDAEYSSNGLLSLSAG